MTRALAVVLATSTVAHAQPKRAPKQADQTFERGRVLMDRGDYAGACAAFEESLLLDFQFGTLYNIADCDDKIGKLASALKAYRKIAHDDFNEARRRSATDLIKSLEPRVPMLTIVVPAKPKGLHVLLDDVPIDDVLETEIPIDVGAHTIKARAPGSAEQTRSIKVAEGESQQLSLKFEVRTPTAQSAEPGTSKRARFGQITLVAGGAVLITGAVLGGVALRDWHDAQQAAMTDPVAANDQVHHVQLLGNLSTVFVITGVAAIATGVYLWRSDHGTLVAPAVGADGGGVSVLGTF